jgi:hypothetical protein
MSVMGPAGVDHLVREMLMTCWRELPEDQKTMAAWRQAVAAVYNRNMKVWQAIKKPSPQAFFDDLAPYAADGHFRQALVLAWMMLPRAGGRTFADVKTIVSDIYSRNIAIWEGDFLTFTKGPAKAKKKSVKSAGGSKHKGKPTSKVKAKK